MGLTRLDCVQSSGLLFLGCQPLSCLRAFVHTVPSIWTSYSFFFTSWTPAYASHLCSNITSSDPQASLGPATMCPEVTFWFFFYLALISLYACVLSYFSRVWLFAALWTVARQPPLSMGFSRQENWSGLPCPPAVDLPRPGIEPVSLMFPALAGRFFTTRTTWEVHWSAHDDVSLGAFISPVFLSLD